MIADLHFLRPWWLLALLPLLGLLWRLWRQNPRMQSLRAVCDEHLLVHLLQNKGEHKRQSGLLFLFLSGVLMSVGLAGPTWFRLPLPSYHALQARVLVLDLSPSMLTSDLPPNRLTRAKFKLHDLLQVQQKGQFGLVVFTGEPFVVSPLTEDGNTIDSLLETLTPAIMPVSGQQLDTALEQAGQLIMQAGFAKGQILVLTASTPDKAAITMASKLYNKGIETSIMPVVADKALPPFFQPLATAGHGLLLPITDTSKDIQQWLHATTDTEQLTLNAQNEIPLWRDEGRWFILPALLFLLPVFWRGWLQRIES
jgi:Ca-activated chloride channel homolog